MTERLMLENGDARVEVLPRLGGSLAAFDLKRGVDRLPVFRRWSGESESPRTFALIPMAPWFARISGGGIHWRGTFYPIARNDPEDTHPLHGDGWRSPWEVAERAADRVSLRLRSRAIPPFDYEARLDYLLSGSTLEVRLAVRNCAAIPVPYGMGLHPWFPRTPDVTLQARTRGTWLPQPPELPTKVEPDPLPPQWDFSTGGNCPPRSTTIPFPVGMAARGSNGRRTAMPFRSRRIPPFASRTSIHSARIAPSSASNRSRT